MTELAAVVLAHADPVHLHRLVAALEDVPVFLHCDARTSDRVHADMTSGLPGRVTLCPRRPTTLGSWSLVDAELVALRMALGRTAARHVAVLSGADYPLMSTPDLVAELARWQGESWIWNAPVPHPEWSTPRNPDGGQWRFQQRFLTRRDQIVYVRGVPLRWPGRRATPTGLTFRASTQWKVYSRHHAEALLQAVDEHPELVAFWRTTLVPEESFVASVLASEAFVGSDVLPLCAADAWYLSWPEGRAHHPRWLGTSDLPALARARRAQSVAPAATRSSGGGVPEHRRLFARKFSSRDHEVLERVDGELRT